MYGCMCGCGGPGYGPQFARRPNREETIEWLAEYQRDLEQRVADVGDEIKRLKDQPQPAS